MKARESICFRQFFSNLQGDFHAIRMFKVFTFPRMNDYDDYSYSAASAATATVKATTNKWKAWENEKSVGITVVFVDVRVSVSIPC